MKKSSFNLDWLFYKENDTNKTHITLPHDAMILERRSKESKAGPACAYFEGGKYYYEKIFTAPEDWKNKSVILEFEGVYQKATVICNEKIIGTNAYGYSNFFITLDDAIICGAENKLTVIADNSNCPNSRWYSGSGIYRNVKLYIGEKEHIVPDSLHIVADSDGHGTISIKTTGGSRAVATIYDIDKEILSMQLDITDGYGEVDFEVTNPTLWDENNPHLYCCRVELINEDTVIDSDSANFGFRTIEWNTKQGLLINGKETLLKGCCIHHDNGILGARGNDDAEYRKIKMLKEAGFNAVRMSHNPSSKAMLEACDEYGMYVMDEFADQWLVHKNPYDYADQDFKENWSNDLMAMINKDYNHPSVIMYSIGNEISELGIKEGIDVARELKDYCKKLDSSRAVTAGINLMLATMTAKGKGMYGNADESKNAGNQSMDSAPTSAFFNMLMNRMGTMMDNMASKKDADAATERLEGIFDINGYNYATSRYAKEGQKYPDRVIVGSETLPKFIYRNWKLTEELPYLIGDFVWTGWDYLGESGIGTVRYKKESKLGNLIISGGPGLIDICGKRRPEMEWNRMIWHLTETPSISVEPMTHAGDIGSVSMWRDTDGVTSWSWPGCEGAKNKVRVYATGAYVELIVNNKSYGKKKTKEFKAEFKKVKYEPGTITAKSYKADGTLIGESSLITSTGDTQIKLTANRTSLKNNGEDLCFIDIDLAGKDDITKSSVDVPVTVEVSGAGKLLALGSARPSPLETFNGNTHTTFLGKAQAIVMAGTDSGEIKVKVSSQELKTVELTVNVN